ncbi:MAG: hypothetical protein IJS67_00375, partial [Clostridia bacterium]|nr:hypothetical protein [Clostridia bacterium]
MKTKTQKFMRVFLVALSAICFAAGIAFMGNVGSPVALADEVEESDFGETTYNVSKSGEHMLLVTPIKTDTSDIYEVGYEFTGENIPDVSDSEKCATNKYY